jgi:hypothetical protein
VGALAAVSAPFRIAPFRADVTPALGAPLCGGLIASAERIEHPLLALGVAILSDEDPIVLCALDWCEICNGDYVLWRERLAEAAKTSPDRVAVHCVHQHDAPLTDLTANAFLREQNIEPGLMDETSFHGSIERVCKAIREALSRVEPVTEIRAGTARVERIASNRRVPAADGRIRIRWSRCADPELRAEPEGTIDPELITIGFWNGPRKIASLHFYAVHPMSAYGGGGVSYDFVGMARERRTREERVPHLYFTGCAGDITAGKYNAGEPGNREAMADRLYAAMVASEESATPYPAESLQWRTAPVMLPRSRARAEDDLLATLGSASETKLNRTLAAIWLSFLRAAKPIPVAALRLGDQIGTLHLPGEASIGYQLFAKSLIPGKTLAVASYTDVGMGYIPLERHFQETGGYEETWAFAAPESEAVLKEAIRAVLSDWTD